MQKSDIVITDYNAFEEIIKSIENSCNRIKEANTSERQNKEMINSTNTWTGQAQQVMYEKLSTLCENFPGIEASCDVYIHFLKKTLNDYKEMVNALNRDTDALAETLDVNS